MSRANFESSHAATVFDLTITKFNISLAAGLHRRERHLKEITENLM